MPRGTLRFRLRKTPLIASNRSCHRFDCLATLLTTNHFNLANCFITYTYRHTHALFLRFVLGQTLCWMVMMAEPEIKLEFIIALSNNCQAVSRSSHRSSQTHIPTIMNIGGIIHNEELRRRFSTYMHNALNGSFLILMPLPHYHQYLRQVNWGSHKLNNLFLSPEFLLTWRIKCSIDHLKTFLLESSWQLDNDHFNSWVFILLIHRNRWDFNVDHQTADFCTRNHESLFQLLFNCSCIAIHNSTGSVTTHTTEASHNNETWKLGGGTTNQPISDRTIGALLP